MVKENNIYVSSYGDENGNNRGIVRLKYRGNEYIDKVVYRIEGKVNCIIEYNQYFYIPVKEKDHNYIYVLILDKDELIFQRKIVTQYFYSHGFMTDDEYLCLASYENGVDAIVDVNMDKEISLIDHTDGHSNGKCHYIAYTPDHKYVFSIENFHQKIYIYKIENHQLMISSIVQFGNEGIRLMPYSTYSNCFYLNTEKTNILYTLKWEKDTFVIKDKIALCEPGEMIFSGGNAISEDGKFLCVSLRGKNELQYYAIEKDGTLNLLDIIKCGNMPRDIKIHNATIFVTCSVDHKIEVYQSVPKLEKINEIAISSPITFSV